MENAGMNLSAMLKGKCPSCGKGDLFKHSLWSFNKPIAIHHRCPECNEDFQREPGFYFGAAYVSYGLTVGLWVAVFVAYILLML